MEDVRQAVSDSKYDLQPLLGRCCSQLGYSIFLLHNQSIFMFDFAPALRIRFEF